MEPYTRLSDADLDAVLPWLLVGPETGAAVTAVQREGFYRYLAEGGLTWEGWCLGSARAPRAVFLALLLPGATAIVMIPPPGAGSIEAGAQRELTRAGLGALAARHLHYAQALLEPEAGGKRKLLMELGFTPLAPLVYMERDARYPWVEPPPARAAEWIAYSTATHGEFARVLLATYDGSQDCPELTGLRPMDDILAAHRASGRWEPTLWELARIDGAAVGCVLLADLGAGSMLEIVYMGVVSEFRRRGVGRLLLARALEQARRARVARVTVVVDGRNEPARRLYERVAFTPTAQRDAYLYRWRGA